MNARHKIKNNCLEVDTIHETTSLPFLTWVYTSDFQSVLRLHRYNLTLFSQYQTNSLSAQLPPGV